MSIMRWLLLLLLTAPAFAADVVVDASYTGTAGDNSTYASLADAIAAAPAGQSADHPTRVLIHPGKYKQQLTIATDNLALIGVSGDPADTIITDDLNARTPKPDGKGTYGTTGASSTFIKGNNVTAVNLTFENSTPLGGSQAVALKTTGDEIAFDHCTFTSFQDTLYVTGGRDFFKDCHVSGSVDFIFGNATAVFDHCTINSSYPGAVTAANTQAATAVGMVFLDCTLTHDPTAAKGAVILGRPWQYDRTDACVVYIRCKMDDHISPKGWGAWDSKNTNPAGDSRYAEYLSIDLSGKPIDTSKRVAWSHQLTEIRADDFTLDQIFGRADMWWTDGWLTFWSTRNHPVDRYIDWKLGGTWDPAKQIGSAEAK
jgi:pectinesterase